MDAQERETAVQVEPIQMAKPHICAVDAEKATTQGTDAAKPDMREAKALEPEPKNAAAAVEPEQGHVLDKPGGDAAQARVIDAEPLEAQANESVLDSRIKEEETQLAAIRELMTRAGARGLWLTLGEIAEATEFAEASISAQLRHLRKPRHGRHRVEKRRRGRRRTAVARSVGDGRRGPVIWEYRILPRTAGSTGPSTFTARSSASIRVGESEA